ncbi:hypothetical protein MMC17_003180 [Xylographa soralifera]|nr:hypothetical protein [Xylographa soralifera]
MRYTLCTPHSLPLSERTCTTYTVPPILFLGFVVVTVETLYWCIRRRKRAAMMRAVELASVRERERRRREREMERRSGDVWGDLDGEGEGEGVGVDYGEEGEWNWGEDGERGAL